MATQNSINPTFRNVKQEYEDKQLTHTCPKCSVRYPNSGMLVHHMNEEHSTFVQQTAFRIARAADKLPSLADGEKYRNTMATCPYCKHDCQTRKKLMMHLETAHKDDEEQQDEEPRVKVIRLDGSFVTPGAPELNVVQNFIKAMGNAPGRSLPNGTAKLDNNNKSAAKLQYKCFWCDASFRKRGKLMDHIDTLHKHNKLQNQAEADSLNEPNKAPSSRPLTNQRSMSHLELSKFAPGLQLGVATRSPHPVDTKPLVSNTGSCSFTLAGSLTKRTKKQITENTPPNTCKFYLGKKDNPLANKKARVVERTISQPSSRRFSLPNVFDDASNPSYNFPYNRMTAMTAAMQHSYMMGIRPPLINATQFYAPPRMPMVMPSSDYVLNHAHPTLDQQQASNQQAQFFARMNAMHQMSPLATNNRPKTSSESPLDLTKSYNI